MVTSALFLSPCCKSFAVYADIYEGCERQPFCQACRKPFKESEGLPIEYKEVTISSKEEGGRMNQVKVTEEKKMTVAERKEKMPYEVLADGVVIAVVAEKWIPRVAKTQCPNCRFVYTYSGEERPFFFSTKRG